MMVFHLITHADIRQPKDMWPLHKKKSCKCAAVNGRGQTSEVLLDVLLVGLPMLLFNL